MKLAERTPAFGVFRVEVHGLLVGGERLVGVLQKGQRADMPPIFGALHAVLCASASSSFSRAMSFASSSATPIPLRVFRKRQQVYILVFREAFDGGGDGGGLLLLRRRGLPRLRGLGADHRQVGQS